ncbi:hypothetical protein SPBR_01729 [Sporothrix brasiliensis 5110]|uniref:RRM domain-containing protein n=1 Tax=Sporothrix brasiliensis 5110 TaxID=1398154 RepID=A0A0C2EZE0_9PEZI|nr:uncharacterized protein SPBR_01729 [Sporothrix brasiliensis 5110]KIH91879.1 hypothetical protein SPBR_01729 [Sporothrix brasiliensis 5110]
MESSFPRKEAAAAGSNSPPDDASVEESSRVFVKNLPPNITDDQLRKHFSGGGRHITDLKLIARRRIAFIGYRSADEAKAAVRYFNRSFIRMSKLSVELAKPITDPTLPTAYKMQRLHDLHNPAAAEPAAPAPPADDEAASKKRKREDLDVASNPKLREFLDVMSTQNRGLSSTADVTSAMGAGAFGVAGEAAVPEAILDAEESENEDEYQSISTKKAKTTKDEEGEGTPAAPAPSEPAAEAGRPSRVAAITATSIEEEEARPTPSAPEPTPTPLQPKLDSSATDDDWLRSRTNRLLDLLDPSELPAPSQPVAAPAFPTAFPAATKKDDEEMPDANNEHDNANDDYENPIRRLAPAAAPAAPAATTAAPTPAPPVVPLPAEEQIRKTSRLFVRNLPYDATEAQIQKYFTAFGTVQEIGTTYANGM